MAVGPIPHCTTSPGALTAHTRSVPFSMRTAISTAMFRQLGKTNRFRKRKAMENVRLRLIQLFHNLRYTWLESNRLIYERVVERLFRRGLYPHLEWVLSTGAHHRRSR